MISLVDISLVTVQGRSKQAWPAWRNIIETIKIYWTIWTPNGFKLGAARLNSLKFKHIRILGGVGSCDRVQRLKIFRPQTGGSVGSAVPLILEPVPLLPAWSPVSSQTMNIRWMKSCMMLLFVQTSAFPSGYSWLQEV